MAATARRSGLGKGLASLIPPGASDATGVDDALREVSVTSIAPNPGQPRAQFDEESLSELTASIRALGVLQPVLVREVDTDQYQLIAGERRWRAARRAGLTTIPAIIRRADDRGVAEQALVENVQRQDLTPLEEAAAFQQLIEDFGLTHDEVASRVGKSRSTVTNTVRLLQLPPAVQRMVAEGQLSAGHARALLATPDRALQEQLARTAVEEHWTVRETEDAVRQPPVDEAEPIANVRALPGMPSLRPPGLLELEGLLADYLNTRVSITMRGARGRVAVEFATLEDLERIYRLITENSEHTFE
jgi:ParB family transcriptional regulator, chromosome partitioning protein